MSGGLAGGCGPERWIGTAPEFSAGICRSVGGGTVGAGTHAEVARATHALIAVAEAHQGSFGRDDVGALPPEGQVRIQALTTSGTLIAVSSARMASRISCWVAMMVVFSWFFGFLVKDRSVLGAEAAIDGQGVALGGQRLAEDFITRGALVRPISATMRSTRGFYLLVPLDAPLSKPAKLFRDWIVAEAKGSKKVAAGKMK